MKKTTAGALLLALGLCIAGAGAGLAQGSADDMITARQSQMTASKKALKTLVSILKGETPYDTATVQAAVKSITDAKAAADAADVWNPASQTGATIQSGAKPEVWTDAEGFAAAWKTFDTAVTGMAAVTDEASFKVAFPALGAACKGCHEKYRQAE